MAKFGLVLDFLIHSLQVITFITLAFAFCTLIFTGTTGIDSRVYWLILFHIPTACHFIMFCFRSTHDVRRVYIYYKMVLLTNRESVGDKSRAISNMEVKSIVIYSGLLLAVVFGQTLSTAVGAAIRAKWYFADSIDTTNHDTTSASLLWVIVDFVILGISVLMLPLLYWTFTNSERNYTRASKKYDRLLTQIADEERRSKERRVAEIPEEDAEPLKEEGPPELEYVEKDENPLAQFGEARKSRQIQYGRALVPSNAEYASFLGISNSGGARYSGLGAPIFTRLKKVFGTKGTKFTHSVGSFSGAKKRTDHGYES